ncbi:MAG: hypothetical protein IH624_20055 [Phycisphaerae bacterium]|nr:hypothetical protein [Phycisphaerae bacterium]
MSMQSLNQRFVTGLAAVGLLAWALLACGRPTVYAQPEAPVETPDAEVGQSQKHMAVVIPCEDMIDDGLYASILRRSEEAIAMGATHIIFEIDTYGGLVKSADDISTFFILELKQKVHTVAYVTKKAISAGAMISVSCQDIIMRQNTTIGDSAPITMGGTLEGVEREKAESFIRAIFTRAAEANGYPEPLLRAMVSVQLEVYRVQNLETGKYEFFETNDLPKEDSEYDLENKELVVRDDQILTLTAARALEYGVARAVVESRQEALAFLEQRDGIKFSPDVPVLEPLWSEQMVRWINSPTVMAVLVMLAMLGVYLELNTPGVGLPGLVAVIAIVIIVGSKYLVGMANWLDIAIFVVGLVLLLVEIFVIPGFGIAGITGIIFILVGILGMLIPNAPGEVPLPRGPVEWDMFLNGLTGLTAGFIGFLIAAAILVHYLPESGLFAGIKLAAAPRGEQLPVVASGGRRAAGLTLAVGQCGRVVSTLRPAGQARFDDLVVDVVSQGEFVGEGAQVEILEIHGNRVVVKAC